MTAVNAQTQLNRSGALDSVWGAETNSDRARILYYNHTGVVAGAEMVLKTMLENLDRRRFESILVCPAEGGLLALCEPFADVYRRVQLLQARFTLRPDHLLRYLFSIVRLVKELRSIIAQSKPDIIHANSVRAGIVCTFASIGNDAAVVWYVHDRTPKHPLSTAIRMLALASSRVRSLAITQDSARSFRGRLLSRFPERAKTTVVLNAIDTQRFQPEPQTRAAVRAELGLGDDEFVIGIVGQISPHKGQLGLVRAFARVQDQIPNAVLLIVGAPLFNKSAEYLDELVRTADSLDIMQRVRFLGQRSDIPRVMQALDLFILNSDAEAFGLVVVEAMASGTPVVATGAGGIPELIQDGVTGFLVPPGDDSALAQTILRVAADGELLRRVRESALLEVEARFSLSRYVEELHRFYEQIMSERESSRAIAKTTERGG